MQDFFATIEKTEKSKSAKNTVQAQARNANMAYFGATIEKNNKMHYVLFNAQNASEKLMQALELSDAKDRMRVNTAKAQALIQAFKSASEDERADIEVACNTIIDLASIERKQDKLQDKLQAQE